MARYEKAGEAQRPQWEPDVARIIDGTPFTTEGLSESEAAAVLTPCPGPVLAMNAAGKAFQWDCPGERYPNGPWQQRSDPQGNCWWIHAEFHRRSQMKQFQRRIPNDSEAPRRVFEGARK